MGAQGGPGGVVGEAGDERLDRVVQGVDHVDRGAAGVLAEWSGEVVFGGDVEGVEVAGGGLAEPGGGVGLLAQQGGGGAGASSRARICSRMSVGGGRADGLGSDDACAGRRRRRPEVEVVGVARRG